jgi:cell division protein FtsI (penicillin-binding protein 3)
MAEKANVKKEVITRIYIGFLLVCFLAAGIVGKAIYTQSVKGNYYISLADSLTIYPAKIKAERGNIYAHDGKLLAASLPVFDLYIDFAAEGLTKEIFDENIDSVSLLMANMFPDKSSAEYKRAFILNRNKKNRYYSLRRNVGYDQLLEIKKMPWLRLKRNVSGLIEENKERRDHPFGYMALRTLGVDENFDGIYSSGIELKYDSQLKGKSGKKLVQKLGAGVIRPLDSKEEVAPQPGRDIYTTIDITIQDVSHDALRRALVKHKADHGCVVVMEVKTGKIRAMANLGKRDSVNYFELLNYAVGESTEPGSTFKVATIAALMEDGIVNKSTKVNCGNGTAAFYNTTIKDHEPPATPILDVKRIIEVSSNVGVAKLSFQNYAASPSKFYNHLKNFGFADSINIEVIGSKVPDLKKPKHWSGVTSAFIAHGYEIRITPLHTLQFYNAIANNGVLVRPTLVEKITHYSEVIDSTKVISHKILSESTVSDLREILEGVVEQGTAMNLKTNYLKIAGKTGTAKVAQLNKGYKEAIYQASFCGYFPSDNPQYSMIVVVNSPSAGGYYGNVVAGSIFREVADKIYATDLQFDNVQKDSTALNRIKPLVAKSKSEDVQKIYSALGFNVSVPESEWVQLSNNGYKSFAVNENLMPDVRGMSQRDALFMLESIGLKITFSGKGFVRGQSIQPGEQIKKGQHVKLELLS